VAREEGKETWSEHPS